LQIFFFVFAATVMSTYVQIEPAAAAKGKQASKQKHKLLLLLPFAKQHFSKHRALPIIIRVTLLILLTNKGKKY